jgi:phthalate 4,5-dioxygenase oxygenase subunit
LGDRSQEHLGPADKGIIQMRRLLRDAVNTVRAGGIPAGVAPSYYDFSRSGRRRSRC